MEKKYDVDCSDKKYNCECGPKCKNAKVTSNTLCECTNNLITPGKIKVPCVLAEFTVQIVVEGDINLEEKAIEIKRIKKDLYLNQCRLVTGTNKLFLQGYVRKNIEYATKQCVNEEGTAISGDIKHTTVYVPFECVTPVDFSEYPDTEPNANPTETQYLNKCCNKCNKLMGINRQEHDFWHKQIFNEPVFCELEEAEIYEVDIEDKGCRICKGYPDEHEFKKIKEKIVIELTLKLLQKQQMHNHGC